MHSDTQIKAYKALKPGSLHTRIAAVLKAAGSNGLIDEEIQSLLDHRGPSGSVNGRYSELVRYGVLFRRGDERIASTGQAQEVLRHVDFITDADRATPPQRIKPKGSKAFHRAVEWMRTRVDDFSDLGAFKTYLDNEIHKTQEA